MKRKQRTESYTQSRRGNIEYYQSMVVLLIDHLVRFFEIQHKFSGPRVNYKQPMVPQDFGFLRASKNVCAHFAQYLHVPPILCDINE